MSTFERIRMATWIVAFLPVAAAGCDAPAAGACLRFSDCASGLTCAAGQCVSPPSPVDASAPTVDATAATPAPAPGDESAAPNTDESAGDGTTNPASDDASNPTAE